MPNPKFPKVNTRDDVVWAVSDAAAAEARITPATNIPGLRNL